MTDVPTPAAGQDYAIGPLLQLAARRAARTVADALAPLGIEGRHFGVLLQLVRVGPLSQRELVELTGSDKSAMVRTVDDLEAKGLATRGPAPRDRRAHAVAVTAAGRELFTEAERVARRVGRELVACLPPEDRDRLTDLLRRFAAG